VRILRDKSARPYGFVQFANSNDADSATTSGEMQLGGRVLRVQKANVQRVVLVCNQFQSALDERRLLAIATLYGPCESVQCILDGNGQCTPMGVITFTYREDAVQCWQVCGLAREAYA
jgi:hypothetical protein